MGGGFFPKSPSPPPPPFFFFRVIAFLKGFAFKNGGKYLKIFFFKNGQKFCPYLQFFLPSFFGLRGLQPAPGFSPQKNSVHLKRNQIFRGFFSI